MSDDAFRAEQEKLATARREAEDRVLQAQTTQGIIKEDHDKLTTKMFEAATPEDRSALQSQVAEHAEKLRNANATLQERQTEVNAFKERETEGEKFVERMDATATNSETGVEFAEDRIDKWNELATEHEAAPHGDMSEAPHVDGMEAHIEVPEMPHFALGGTSKPIGETMAYAAHVTYPVVKAVGITGAIKLEIDNLVSKADAFAQSVEAKLRNEKTEQELSDAQKLEKENEAHQKNVSQLSDLQEKISKQFDQDDSQKQIDTLIKETQKVIKEQDERTRDSCDGNYTTDPAAREQQFQNRVENEKDLNAKRYGMVNELLTPMAEANVLDKHFQTLEKEAENNKELLKMNEKRLKDQPDADIKQKEYETKLNNGLAEKEKTLDARWQQDVQQELGGLRRDHFPEVRTPTMDGPALAQSGPSQPGPGGGGGGSAMAPQQSGPGDGGAGGGPPQQQGPALQM